MRSYVKEKMFNTTVTVKTPATFNASNYPLTYTEQTVKARYIRKSKLIEDDAGNTQKATAVIMVNTVDTSDATVTITNATRIEYNSNDVRVLTFEEIWDDTYNSYGS